MRSAIVAAIGAASLVTVPVPAIAASALSVAQPAQRAGAELQEASAIRGGFILPALGILLVAAALVLLLDDDEPASP